MKEAILIIIGALISCGTTFLLDCIKFNREEKIYYKRKKEEAYLEMQDFITDLTAHWKELKSNYLSNELRLKYNALRSKAHLYGKKETVDIFYELATDLMTGKHDETYQKRNLDFINLIKEELNIKE